MKYIRTKQGHIYKRLYKDGALNRGVGYIVQGVIMPFGEDVIAESNTIEELCDEFVIDKFGEKDVYEELSIGLIHKHLVRNHIIYGAIWTDEGLIYVAKTNDKGKWELL